jgi:hypothetical protein
MTVRPPKGARILGTTTRLDYIIDNGVLDKRKVRMCVLGNHQSEDSSMLLIFSRSESSRS